MNMNEKQLQSFREEHLKHRFSLKALNYHVVLSNTKKSVYVNLDNAATTTPFLSVIKGVEQDLIEYGSVHRWSGTKSDVSTVKYESVRDTIKTFVNARSDDYALYVPNTTAWINQLAYFFSFIKGKIFVADVEHSSSMLPWVFYEWRMHNSSTVSLQDAMANTTEDINQKIMHDGRKNVITYKTNEDFSFDLSDVERIFKEHNGPSAKLEDKIKVLVVTWASNVTWYKPPIHELSKIAHKYWALIVVDACQFLQHEKIDMQKDNIDFVLFSGHKMYASYGLWGIVWRKDVLDAFRPYQMWWGNFPYISAKGQVLRQKNEQAHDPGTPNFVWARALHYAIKELESIWYKTIHDYEHALVQLAFDEMKKIPGITIYVQEKYLWSLITFNLEGFHPKLVSEVLNDDYGIWTRAWAYCVYNFSRRIHNITDQEDERITQEVIDWNLTHVPGSVRASFSLINNVKDVKKLIKALKEISSNGAERYLKIYTQASSWDWSKSWSTCTNHKC